MDSLGIPQSESMVKLCRQILFVIGYDDAALRAEAFRGCDLVVVAGLAKLMAPGHYDDWLSQFEGRYDRPHPRVSYDDPGFPHHLVEFQIGRAHV